jgi:sphingomyelin phosphodiesterase
LSDLLKKKIKVPVIPALGNHESYPVNVYEWGKGNSIQLNDGVAEAWKDWIGPEAAKVVK